MTPFFRSQLRASSEQFSSLLEKEAANRDQLAETNRKYTDSRLDSLEEKFKAQVGEALNGRKSKFLTNFFFCGILDALCECTVLKNFV